MSKPEHPRKKAQREAMEKAVEANSKLTKNPSPDWVRTNLFGKVLRIQGVPHLDPILDYRFPVSNAYIHALPTVTRNRVGATHFIQIINLGHSPHKVHGLSVKVNLRDFPITVLDDTLHTYKGQKYLRVGLDDNVWASVLLPVHQDIFFREEV